jgi:multiple antibiotic resistance protein
VLKAFLVLFAASTSSAASVPMREKAGKIYPARATIVSGSIMIVFLYLGETILSFLGIDVNSFAVAGSLVLFFIALEMTLGIRLFKEDTSAPGLSEDPKVPASPGLSISPVPDHHHRAFTARGIHPPETWWPSSVVVVTVLLLTNRIERMLGRVGLIVLRKAFGVILLAISVKLFAGNITYLFPG